MFVLHDPCFNGSRGNMEGNHEEDRQTSESGAPTRTEGGAEEPR